MLRPTSQLILAASISFICFSSVASTTTWTVGQTVGTTSGTIKGHAASQRTEVSEYLGIPYAESPIGDLRFAAPVKYLRNDTIDATNFGLACPQAPLVPFNFSFPRESPNTEKIFDSSGVTVDEMGDDCLNLNVWTKPQTGEEKKAVFVWIYGGGLHSGASRAPTYNGQYIADEEDVVVVSINYRLNVFGFPQVPELERNAGLLDQRTAIEWVRDNVEAFGGDPSRIVIGGQSAGSLSVDYYSYAWTEDPIVSGFIMESRNANELTVPGQAVSTTPTDPLEPWFNMSSTLGCGGPDAGLDATIPCVRKKDFIDVVQAIPPGGGGIGGDGSFRPSVDDKVVFADYDVRGAQGRFIQKPYIIGNNNNEGAYFEASLLAGGVHLPEVEYDIFDLIGFTCPAAQAASWRAEQHTPIWRYRYFGDFQNLRLFDGSGAYHAEEIPVYFGTSEIVSGEAPSTYEVNFGNYMRGAFMSFVKDPENGLRELGWPTYDPNTASLIRLAYPNEVAASAISPADYDYVCLMLPEISNKLDSDPVVNLACRGKANTAEPYGETVCKLNFMPKLKALFRNSTATPPTSTDPVTTSLAVVSINPPRSEGSASSRLSDCRINAFLAFFAVLVGLSRELIFI